MGLKTASGTTLGGGEPRGRDRVRAMDDEELMNSVGLILVLEAGLAAPRRNRVRERLRELGAEVTVIDGGERTYLEVRGQDLAIRTLNPQHWPGVDRVLPLTPPYPHAARRSDSDPTRAVAVDVAGVSIGGDQFAVIGGPCAIEDEARTIRLAEGLRESGCQLFRGGAFKPRTSPYAFQGLEEEGLRILAKVREVTGLPIVTEVMDSADIPRVAEVADLMQVGSRNMQNFSLLKKLGAVDKPVLLKRGSTATVEEWLLAAEYILSGGNHRVILCERGIRHVAGSDQVVLDLGAIPELRRRSHLPILVDPSHGSGATVRVPALACAAAAAGADGLLIEVHDDPTSALSDGQQALTLDAFHRTMHQVGAIHRALQESRRDTPEIEEGVIPGTVTTPGKD